MSEKFKQYKRKLRWKSTMRKQSVLEPQMTCPECGAPADHTQASQFVGTCGHVWDKFPIEQLKQDLGGIPEPYSESGHRCPMCKNHRLIEMGDSLLCPECNWAGEKFNLSDDQMPPPSE